VRGQRRLALGAGLLNRSRIGSATAPLDRGYAKDGTLMIVTLAVLIAIIVYRAHRRRVREAQARTELMKTAPNWKLCASAGFTAVTIVLCGSVIVMYIVAVTDRN
jgi:putative exporter of polyketide antibiotics